MSFDQLPEEVCTIIWSKLDFETVQKTCTLGKLLLLHFVAFFHVASLLSTGVDNKKVGVDNKKALELTNSTVFHRGRQQKSSRADKQHCFP